jgi:hypothetical protein
VTILAIRSVGFCAHYSGPGDWAFSLALAIARSRGLRLNIFHFLADPYAKQAAVPATLSKAARVQSLIERERELRTYYDARLGDYLKAGFRLCEQRSWAELHRCFSKREFQVLVLARPSIDAFFGGVPLEEFAGCFVCPVVLVGPSHPGELCLNPPAALLSAQLDLASSDYRVLDPGGRGASGRIAPRAAHP